MRQLITILCTLAFAINAGVALEYFIRDGQAYKVFTQKFNYTDAMSECAEHGMELISIPNERIQNETVELMKMYGLKESWTSGTNFEERGAFKWVGQTFPCDGQIYTNWNTASPLNVTNRSAIVISSSLNYKWGTQKSYIASPFICLADLNVFLSLKCSKCVSLLRTLGEH